VATPLGTIFVVDDEVYLQDLYADLLGIVGHQIVDTAFNGEEAVLKYESMERKPDLVIMDHRMPIKNGVEATREILSMDPRAKILFISADVSQESRVQEIGAVGFLEKPFPMDKLFRTIDNVLKQVTA
jgi:two-component system chemotaxis response regulator CheY